LPLLILFLYDGHFKAFPFVYYKNTIYAGRNPVGIPTFFLVGFHHPAALSLADMIAERNSKIPLALRRK
jgi:hypothetical protein